MKQDRKLVVVELNEINFYLIKKYTSKGYLPNFKKLMNDYSLRYSKTNEVYSNQEPWINWVTFRTGKNFAKHKVFHLGDFNSDSPEQHYEILSKNGYKVAAICPMNSVSRAHTEVFIPDPWSDNAYKGSSFFIKKIVDVIQQSVRQNVSNTNNIYSYFIMLAAVVYFGNLKSFFRQIKHGIGSFKNKWIKAVMLDELLQDIFLYHFKKNKLNYLSVFLNAGAHIQHHYFFNSIVYDGLNTNPDWYINKQTDPVLYSYESYDKFIGALMQQNKVNKSKVVIATGLSQEPCEKTIFYWKLKVNKFLKSININDFILHPKMSRDFELEFDSISQMNTALLKLRECEIENEKIFNLHARSNRIFCEFVYGKNIDMQTSVVSDDGVIIPNFIQYVEFVAIKNGKHKDEGFVVDNLSYVQKNIPLTQVHDEIIKYFE